MKTSLGAKTILYPTPVLIVATYDADGKPNMMNAAWGGICNSNPPSVSVSLRAATYSHGNIMKRQAFTINVPSVAHVRQADFVGMCSGADTDKFAATGLTPVKSELVDAPYIKEFPLVLECKVLQANVLGLHTQFIGQIMDVKADDSVLDAAGAIDVAKLQPMIFAPTTQAYYAVRERVGKAFSIGSEIAGGGA